MVCSMAESHNTKIKVQVRVGETDITLVGSKPAVYMHRVAAYVEDVMKQIDEKGNGLSSNLLGILTSVHIADELLQLKEDTAQDAETIKQLKKEISRLEQENKALRRGAPSPMDRGGKPQASN
jgi:cell division protein ZapA (FtsZ GTPase activity inhibitor)